MTVEAKLAFGVADTTGAASEAAGDALGVLTIPVPALVPPLEGARITIANTTAIAAAPIPTIATIARRPAGGFGRA